MNKRKKVVLIIVISVMVIVVIILLGLFLLNNKNNKTNKVSFKEVKKELETYEFGEYSNLKFDCQVPKINADKIYELVLVPKSTSDEYEVDLLQNLIESYSGITVDKNEITLDNCAYINDIHGTKIGGHTFPDHTYTLWNGEKGRFDPQYHVTEKTINLLNNEDYKNEYYTDGDKQISVRETVDYVNDFIEDNLAQYFNSGEDIVLTDIMIAENSQTKEKYCALHYHHEYEGILVNDAGFSSLETNYLEPSFLEIVVFDVNNIEWITNRYYYSIEEANEVKDGIIPLSSATEMLSQKLAPFNSYKVSEVALKYVSVVNYGDENRVKKPMWCYTLNEYDFNGAIFFPCLTACVDAQTGEVYLYDMKNSMMLQ